MALNLFPARAAIGDANGVPVYQTTEFARALADLLVRVGGPDGMSITAIQKELARRPSTLAQSAEAANLSYSTGQKVLAAVDIPAKAMGSSGMVRITTTWSVTNSEREKTIRIRFGGFEVFANAVTTVSTYQAQQLVQNRSSTKQIFVHGGFSFTGEPLGSLSADTDKAQKVEIVGELADARDAITLEAYTVELIPTL